MQYAVFSYSGRGVPLFLSIGGVDYVLLARHRGGLVAASGPVGFWDNRELEIINPRAAPVEIPRWGFVICPVGQTVAGWISYKE